MRNFFKPVLGLFRKKRTEHQAQKPKEEYMPPPVYRPRPIDLDLSKKEEAADGKKRRYRKRRKHLNRIERESRRRNRA